LFNLPLAIPDLQKLGINSYRNLPADQTAVDRISILQNPNSAGSTDLEFYIPVIAPPTPGQLAQDRKFFPQTFSSTGIKLLKEFGQKGFIIFSAGKIPTAP
jgi:hypothetical protein